MATEQRLVDDIDGSDENVQTTRFSWGGDDYEIDLSSENRVNLAAHLLAINEIVEKAHKVPRRSAYAQLTVKQQKAIRADLHRPPRVLITDEDVEAWLKKQPAQQALAPSGPS